MLTLWDMLSPLMERLQPAKRVEPKPLVRTRPRGPSVGKQKNAAGDAALFVPARKRDERVPPNAARGRTAADAVGASLVGARTAATALARTKKRVPMQERYDAIVKEMLQTYGVRVRKWRTSMSGVAWYVEYRDGSVVRLLESPKPKSPMSLAIFLHEIGHHAIGLGIHKPRCLEELLAWNYAVQKMEERGFDVTDRVKRRMHRSLKYAVGKAMRRGLRVLPPELEPYR